MVLICFYSITSCDIWVHSQTNGIRWCSDLLTIYRPPTHPTLVDIWQGRAHLWF